jgi:O-antigen/teichoic acid export membrane protein
VPVTPALRPVFAAGWQWIFLAQLVNLTGTWALVKVVSNLVGVEEFGHFGIMLAVAFGVNALLFGPVAAWAQRHYQEAVEAAALSAYYRTLAVVLAAAALAGTTPLLLAASYSSLVHRVGLSTGVVALALVLGIVFGLSDVLVAIANAAFHRRPAAAFLVASTWIRVGAVGIAYLAGEKSAPAFVAAMSIALALMIPVQLVALRRREREVPPSPASLEQSYLNTVYRFLLPLVLWGVPGYILSFGDRFLLAYYTTPATVGVYVAMSAATINVVNSFSAAANRVLEPAIYAASGAGSDPARARRAHEMVRVTTTLAVLAAAPLVILYALFPERVVSFFSSGAYTGKADYLWLMLIATIVFAAGQQLIVHGLVLKRPWVYVPIKYVHASVLVVALLYSVPRWGVPGVVYSLLAAHALQLCLVVATNRVRLGIH